MRDDPINILIKILFICQQQNIFLNKPEAGIDSDCKKLKHSINWLQMKSLLLVNTLELFHIFKISADFLSRLCIYKIQMHEQFERDVRELELKRTNTAADNAELKMLLNYYLRYPSVEKAQIHHRACNLGTNDLISNQKKMETQIEGKKFAASACQCCGLLVNNEILPYNTKLSDLNIGLAVHLFFKNYKFHILIFTLMFLIYSMFAFISNIRVYNDTNTTQIMCLLTASSSGGCGLSPIGAGSKVLNQNSNSNTLSVIQSWIGVGFVALWGLLYIIKTHSQQGYIYQMEQKKVSACDFTLMLTHIPKSMLIDKAQMQKQNKEPAKVDKSENKYGESSSTLDVMLSQEDLRLKFNKIFIDYERKIESKFSYEVIKVNVAKPLFNKSEVENEREERVKAGLQRKLNVFRSWVEQRKTSTRFLIPAATRDKYYDQFVQYYVNSSDMEQKTVGLAEDNILFVTLRSSEAMRQIQRRNKPPALSNFWNIFKQNDFPIEAVKVRKAPHPEEIKWNCIGFPLKRKRTRRFFMWLFTIILIGVSLGISVGIAFINKDQINIGVSIGISIVVTLINIGIQLVIVHASYYENEYISSREQSMIALKIGLGQIANSIGVPIIVTIISQSNTSMKQKSWLKAGGLVDDVFFIAIINVLVPIINFMDPWQQYLRFRRWWNEKPYERLRTYGQKQYNKLYGNYNFDIGYEYAYLIKTSIFTSFFVCMQPIISLFAPIGLLLYYLSTKRNLLYHFQKPNFHFSTINNSVDFILLISLPAYGLGCLLVNNFIEKENQGLSNGTLLSNWIIFIIGIAYLIIVPLRIFYRCIKKPNPPQFDYIQKRMLLNTDYDRLNPETKQKAIDEFKSYLDELEKQQKLPDEAKLMKATIAQQAEHEEEIRKSENNMVRTMVSRIKVSEQNIEPEYNNNLNEYKNIANSFKGAADENNSDVIMRKANQRPSSQERNNSHDSL